MFAIHVGHLGFSRMSTRLNRLLTKNSFPFFCFSSHPGQGRILLFVVLTDTLLWISTLQSNVDMTEEGNQPSDFLGSQESSEEMQTTVIWIMDLGTGSVDWWSYCKFCLKFNWYEAVVAAEATAAMVVVLEPQLQLMDPIQFRLSMCEFIRVCATASASGCVWVCG